MIGGGIEGLGQLTGSQWLQDVGKAQVESNEADIARRNYQRPEEADGIVKNLRQGEFGNALSSLGYSVAESLPSVGVGVGASVGAAIGGTAGLAATGVGTGVGTLMALGEARDERSSQGLDDTANLGDLTTAIASGLVELVPVGKGAGAALKFTKEGLQEAAQEGLIVGNSAFQGGEYVAEDVIHRLADAGITGGVVSKGAGVVNAGAQAAVGKTIRAERFAMLDASLATLFPQDAQSRGFWLKEFYPLASIGNDKVYSVPKKKKKSKRHPQNILADLDSAA
ncbi:hypothetical protein RKLH11_2787 [Rhodobacteraceae bacterium KLH11]|nr:hypothetical protein RKLH11_2787 [Rhodobacteraceae bacterium KLH11]